MNECKPLIIGMQRMLAQRYAAKGHKKTESTSSVRKRKKKKKQESSDGANSDDGEGDADGEEEDEEEEEGAKKHLGGDNQPAKKSMRQGLTLVHFSAQPEPFLKQNAPLESPHTL